MAKIIHKYGGDIVQFVGNSIIAIWPRKLFSKMIENIEDERLRRDRIDEDSNVIVGRKAVQCALEIKIESLKYFSGKNQIFIGVGFGDCGLMHAGGVFNRVEHFLIGKGLTSALRALKYATNEQPCIVS
jgi:class 3 adenylate cyclase